MLKTHYYREIDYERLEGLLEKIRTITGDSKFTESKLVRYLIYSSEINIGEMSKEDIKDSVDMYTIKEDKKESIVDLMFNV